ncbi:NUMOD4 [Hexamita inflata]|uniref:NUMOD4 n=1 Tax=Hexamita inflata TaxID=28002 RepID=A0AA86UNZ5_9EUKA|nr:NUMOD4 [Hexamita inflata]
MNQQSDYEESIYDEEISQEEIIEEYRDISGYPNYEVSNFGQVRNKITGRILKQRVREVRPIIKNENYYCNCQNKQNDRVLLSMLKLQKGLFNNQ